MTGRDAYATLKALTSDTAIACREREGIDELDAANLDLAGLMRFCAEDAHDTLRTFATLDVDELATIVGVPRELAEAMDDLLDDLTPEQEAALLALLAMHVHVGILLGLRLGLNAEEVDELGGRL